MGLSKTDSEILLRDKPEVGREFIRALGKKLTPTPTLAGKIDTHKAPTTPEEKRRQKGQLKVRGGFADMQARLRHLSKNRPFAVKPAGTPGREVWMNVAMDGTNRWSSSYIHCTVSPAFQKDQDLASWWVVKGAEKWKALRTVAQEMNASEQLARAGQKGQVYLTEEDRMEEILFFLLGDGKGQTCMAGCSGFSATAENGCVCHVCGESGPAINEAFGGWDRVAQRAFALGLPFTAVMEFIPPEQRVPDFGLHGVQRMLLCALTGMPGLMKLAHPRKSQKDCEAELQVILDVARLAAKTRSQEELDGEKKDKKQTLRIEATASLWLMKTDPDTGVKRWESLLVGFNNTALDAWFAGFALTCRMAWQSAPFTRAKLEAMLVALREMGRVHRDILGFGVTLWSHTWIDHMYAYAYKWKILSCFSCFRMEGSHQGLKRDLAHSGGVSNAPPPPRVSAEPV